MKANNMPIVEAIQVLEKASAYTAQVPIHGAFDFKWASEPDSEVLVNKISGSGPCAVLFIYD
jgi:hypothetical protein